MTKMSLLRFYCIIEIYQHLYFDSKGRGKNLYLFRGQSSYVVILIETYINVCI